MQTEAGRGSHRGLERGSLEVQRGQQGENASTGLKGLLCCLQMAAVEYNPQEAIKTNVDGSTNVIRAAIERQCSHVIATSIDEVTLQPQNTLTNAACT